jgi:hypothetical protein
MYFIVMIYGQAMYEGILSTQSHSDLATQSLIPILEGLVSAQIKNIPPGLA